MVPPGMYSLGSKVVERVGFDDWKNINDKEGERTKDDVSGFELHGWVDTPAVYWTGMGEDQVGWERA